MKFLKTVDGHFINVDHIVEIYIQEGCNTYNYIRDDGLDHIDKYSIRAVLRKDTIDDPTQLTRDLEKYEFEHKVSEYEQAYHFQLVNKEALCKSQRESQLEQVQCKLNEIINYLRS